MTIKPLSKEIVEDGINLLGINPLGFYQRRNSRLGFKCFDQICQVCNLGDWKEGTSYNEMFVKAFGEQGAEFIRNLPCVIRNPE